MNINKHPIPLSVFAIVVIGLLAANVIQYSNYTNIKDSYSKPHMNGTITTYIDGKLYSQHADQIYGISYDWIICKVYNDSNACSNVGTLFSTGTNGAACKSWGSYNVGSARQSPSYYSKSFCDENGVGLSTDNSVPSGGTSFPQCTNYLSANGLSAVHATTIHSAQTNTITLSATFLATGAQSGIQKVCLFPWSNPDALPVLQATSGNNPYSLVIDSIGSSVPLANGQSLTIQWQFSF